jgi:hypothetical protein
MACGELGQPFLGDDPHAPFPVLIMRTAGTKVNWFLSAF